MKETKQQLIEKDEDTDTFENKWYDEECKFAIEERKSRSITIKEKKLTK